MTSPAPTAQPEMWSSIVELRQYTLHPGMRDVLIDLFDREFVETQEALGMKVIGQFRVLDDPDRFIWLRGYPDMPTREAGLAAFYDGPVWKQHREQANATMIDSDNVLLLRPARPDSGFVFARERAPRGSTEIPSGLVVATIYYVAPSATDFAAFFESALAPAVTAAGGDIVAVLVSETAPNNFPRLPVREGEHVLVYFATFADELAYERHRDELERTSQWHELEKELSRRLTSDPEIRKLRPSARSQLTAENALTR